MELACFKKTSFRPSFERIERKELAQI